MNCPLCHQPIAPEQATVPLTTGGVAHTICTDVDARASARRRALAAWVEVFLIGFFVFGYLWTGGALAVLAACYLAVTTSKRHERYWSRVRLQFRIWYRGGRP